MSSLEAQLLRIIEEQQQQLKQQQQQQQEALTLIQAQARTIEELESYTETLKNRNSKLIERNNLLVEQITTYRGIVKKLSEQTVSEHFSEALQNELATVLKTHVTKLVSSLDVQEELRSLLREILPSLVQAEIEKQTKPLANQISERMNSVEQYQQKLADLIQDISSRL